MSPAPLVARDALVADLRARVLGVRHHGASLLVLAGAAGVGTSAVAEEIVAGHPAATLRARGAAWETGHPYGVLSQLLGSPVEAADPMAAGSALIDAVTDDAGAGDDTTLVVVDDATWCDPESLQALSSAVHHHPDTAVLVLLVSRTGDPTVPAATLRLLAGPDRLVVPPLDAPGVRRLAAARGTHLHPSLADRVCRHTGGRPAHVVALLEELPPDTWNEFDPRLPAPSAIAAEVAARLPTLSAAARSLVEAVAVLGAAATLAEATAVAGLGEPLPALDDAVLAGLLRVVEGRGATLVEPADPLLAAAVLDTLGSARRAAVHARAAEVVTDPARRLGHRIAASPLPDPRLADQLEELAGDRAASGAWSAVAELLAQASRLTD
ncbi:MAG: AAA family ATPase, partial [Nocardioides sp.]